MGVVDFFPSFSRLISKAGLSFGNGGLNWGSFVPFGFNSSF
jgi:hypothetical protein